MSKKSIKINIVAVDHEGKEENLRTDQVVSDTIRSMFQSIADAHPEESEKIGLMQVVSNALDFFDHTRTRIRLTDTKEVKYYSYMGNYKVPFDYHLNYLELPYAPGPLFELVDTTNNNSIVFGIGEILRDYMEHFEISDKKKKKSG